MNVIKVNYYNAELQLFISTHGALKNEGCIDKMLIRIVNKNNQAER